MNEFFFLEHPTILSVVFSEVGEEDGAGGRVDALGERLRREQELHEALVERNLNQLPHLTPNPRPVGIDLQRTDRFAA